MRSQTNSIFWGTLLISISYLPGREIQAQMDPFFGKKSTFATLSER